MAKYTRLNQLGMLLTGAERLIIKQAASCLRSSRSRPDVLKADEEHDDLLEVADQLDTLSAPIVVKRHP